MGHFPASVLCSRKIVVVLLMTEGFGSSHVSELNLTKLNREEEIKQLTVELELKVNETMALSQEYSTKLAKLRSTVDLLQDDFNAVGLYRNSSGQTNCSYLLFSTSPNLGC